MTWAAIIGMVLELTVLLLKVYMGAASDKAKQDELQRKIQEKTDQIARSAETLMRERARKDQAGSGNMQDQMDQDPKVPAGPKGAAEEQAIPPV